MIECIDFHGFNGICDNAVKNFNALPELSPRATEDLIAVFGCPKLEVRDPDEIRPPSPSCASQNAQTYMKKLVKEGFVQDIDFDEIEKELLKSRMDASKSNGNAASIEEIEESDIQAMITQEPYLRFWISTKTVQKIVTELNALPYYDKHQSFVIVTRFYNNITSFVRKARVKQPQIMTNTFLKKQMFEFVTEAQKQREEMINFCISKKLIDTEKLSKELKNEFASSIMQNEEVSAVPKPEIVGKQVKSGFAAQQTNNQESDHTLVQHAKEMMDNFPPTYSFAEEFFHSNYLKEQESKMMKDASHLPPLKLSQQPAKKATNKTTAQPTIVVPKSSNIFPRKRLPHILTNRPIVKSISPKSPPAVIEPKKVDTAKFFWDNEDPLLTRRSSQSDNSGLFHQMRDIIEINIEEEEVNGSSDYFPHLMVKDYKSDKEKEEEEANESTKGNAAVNEDGPLLTDHIWNTSQMSNIMQNREMINKLMARKRGKVHDPNANTLNGFTADELMETTELSQYSQSFKYLMKSNLFAAETDVHVSPEDIALKQLEVCLKELSYNIYMKLEVFKKYSNNTNDMIKIGGYISYWEHAVKMLHVFDICYEELKMYLSFAPKPIDEKNLEYSSLMKNFETSSNALEAAGTALKNVSGDVLYIREKTFVDFLALKSEKINKMHQVSESSES